MVLGYRQAVFLGLTVLTLASAAVLAQAETLSPEQQLGEKLFTDTNLSEPRGVSCASCHDPERAFQGNNHGRLAAVARGAAPERLGARNVPTLLYAALSPDFAFVAEKNEAGKIEHKAVGGQFLDGRAVGLAAQVKGPLLDKNEMNNPSAAVVMAKVRDGNYAALARQVYGDTVFTGADAALVKFSAALAAFEKTQRFMPFASKFDAYLAGKQELTAQEAAGFELFKAPQKGNCLACHVGNEKSRDPHDWPFTDFTYDNLGVPRNPTLPPNRDAAHFDLGLCGNPDLGKFTPPDFDQHSVCGAFKVPTLRNVAVTAPYMHNGYFNTLREVVKFYATRDANPEQWYPKNADGTVSKYDDLPSEYHGNVNTDEVPYDRKPGEPPRLSADEIDAIVAFLGTLTDAPAVRSAK
jgi:cytochrome c peroxidase